MLFLSHVLANPLQSVARWGRAKLTCVALLGAVVCVLSSCGSEQPGERGSSAQRPIVGGTVESGWESVGALTLMHPAYGYVGAFCTATLIDSEWILTAGHCLRNDVSGIPVTPGVVRFYVGSDARNPTAGSLHEVDGFYVHPSYSDNPVQNDIALVHLTTPLTGVTPVAVNTSFMGPSLNGEDFLYVGFGANDGNAQTGSGVKRSGNVAVEDIYMRTYTSAAYDGVGVCFGDSGGPGLFQSGGTWYVMGVNSTVSGGGQDPCLGTGTHTRVDYYDDWITTIMAGQYPDCNDDPNICFCEAACGVNGTCDNSLCEVYDCADINYCMVPCASGNQECYLDCYSQGTTEGRTEFDAITQCGLDNGCYDAADYNTCMTNNCSAVIDVCFTPDTGTATCSELYDCLANCPQDDQLCSWHCYETGTAQDQQTYDEMVGCFSDNCDGIADEEQWLDCINQHCPVEIEECFPPDNCDITGGECDPGQACWPTPGGNTGCYDSDDVALGQTCDPNLTDRLSCGDGMLCASWEGNVCVQLCLDETDCGADEICDKPVFQGIADVGYCTCLDADNDGFCDYEDCDDGDPATYPGAVEACGDNVDNDCDGETDEDCGSCIDGDSDGYCDDVDCDDTDAGIHPAAAEACDNNIDDDCDGETDEGCDTCIDADGDHYCEDLDCDDTDASVRPGAEEVCDDGVDNDCDGETDEGCSACVDADGDGVCEENDCDDTNPQVYPGAEEVCGDGLDNDCDTVVDELCDDGSGSGAKNGGCTLSGAPLSRGDILFVIAALLGLFFSWRRKKG